VPGKILHHGMEGIQRDGGSGLCLGLLSFWMMALSTTLCTFASTRGCSTREGHTPFASAERDLPDDPEGDPTVSNFDSDTEAQDTAPPPPA
jgi:hypothetical protein